MKRKLAQATKQVDSDWAKLGARLREARESAGFRQEDVAQLLEISRPAVSAWESGKTKVDGLLLNQLAKLYRRDLSFFFGDSDEASPDDPMIVKRLGELSTHDKAVIANFLEFIKNLSLLRSLLEYPPRNLISTRPMPSGTRKYAAEVEAKEERTRLGLGDAPIGDRFFSILDMLGLPVYRNSLRDARISGFLVNHSHAGPVIFVNSAQYHWRQVFTAAHEYGHFLFHQTAQTVACRIFAAEGESPDETTGEAFVNAFASEFLMPEDGIKRLLVAMGASSGPLNPEDIVRLQRHFGVSFQAMLYRLLRLRLLRESHVQRMRNEVHPVELAWKMGYPVSGEELGESAGRETDFMSRLPTSYVEMTIDAFEKGLISNGRAAELLELSRAELDAFYRRRRLARESQQVEEGIEHVVA